MNNNQHHCQHTLSNNYADLLTTLLASATLLSILAFNTACIVLLIKIVFRFIKIRKNSAKVASSIHWLAFRIVNAAFSEAVKKRVLNHANQHPEAKFALLNQRSHLN